MMIAGGVDAGSRAIKIVLVESGTGRVIARGAADQGAEPAARAARLFDALLAGEKLRREDVGRIVATGYARELVSFADRAVTEITCHARGVRHAVPEARTVIEIGGQDSKVVWLDESGAVRDFAMNDRCAAGTGRFLEVIAQRLEVPLERYGEIAAEADRAAPINSTCVVFAETEVVGLLAGGESRENVLAGVQKAIASRTAAMLGRRIEEPICFTGGVARIRGMEHALGEALGCVPLVASDPQMTGALGAALLAGEH